MILKQLLFIFVCLAALPVSAYAKKAPSTPAHDSQVPIEVTSDALEVFQTENRAMFTGHVVVIQGGVRLKADKMTVYYRTSQDKSAATPDKKSTPAKSASPGPDSNAIKKIDAVGNVFLATREETASGANGTYDVEHHEIHLNDHVVLTRGQNVLKGDKLTYNFDTGKSVLNGASTPDTGDGQTGKERVRALFVPNKDDKTKP